MLHSALYEIFCDESLKDTIRQLRCSFRQIDFLRVWLQGYRDQQLTDRAEFQVLVKYHNHLSSL